VFIISQSSKLSELKGRLDTLESKKGLHEQVDKIQNEFIHKLQQRATELHDSTQTQLNHSARLTVEIVQQWEQVKLEIEQEMKALRQKRVSTRLAGLEVQIRWLWWSSLDEQWQAIFKEAIGIIKANLRKMNWWQFAV
jgi:hypothetical protein